MATESFRIEGLAGVLDALKKLPPEIVSKAGGPVKHALKTGIGVLRDEAKLNVRKIIDQPNKSGGDESTGLLLLSIAERRTRPTMNQRGEAFILAIRRNQRYPAKFGQNVTAAQVGRQLEFGTEKRRPMPWLRPAFDAKKQAATDAFVTAIRARTQAVIDRVAKQARTKRR